MMDWCVCFADVDECATGHAVCPRFRKCINTFGSYICKCHDGFDLQYINGKFQCTGKLVVDIVYINITFIDDIQKPFKQCDLLE